MVHFGVHVGPQMVSMAELRDTWRLAESLGYEWISVWDHFYPAPAPLDGDCFEAVACHAALAALTERVRVGCLVYSAGYRHPAVLANAGVTIDHISGGRFEMGLGAGWHQWEYDAYGIPFEAPAVRLRRMAEAITVVRRLWLEETVDFEGEFFQLKEARCSPKPIQQPPRIWVGAREKMALRLAGQLGDGWNIAFASPEEFGAKRERVLAASPQPERMVTGVNLGLVVAPEDQLDEALALRFGPLAAAVRPGILAGSVDQIIDRVGQYVEAGADWVVCALRAPFDHESIEAFATEVIPTFH